MVLLPLALTVTLVLPARPTLADGAGLQKEPPLPRIDACSLLTKDEVKKHLPWLPMLDTIPLEKDEIGPSGSGCSYPSVHVQLLTNPDGMLATVRKRGGQEALPGVGDEAYFYENKNGYAEVYVKVGRRMLTLQASIRDGKTVDSVKPGVVSLAKAMAPKVPR